MHEVGASTITPMTADGARPHNRVLADPLQEYLDVACSEAIVLTWLVPVVRAGDGKVVGAHLALWCDESVVVCLSFLGGRVPLLF